MSERKVFHLTERELLMAADGELTKHEQDAIRRHLELCWECRARMAEIERTITQFVQLRRRKLDAALPPIAGRKAELEKLLRAKSFESLETGQRSWIRYLARHFTIRPMWIGATAALTTVLVLMNFVFVPTLSASVLINRAIKAQSRSALHCRAIEYHMGGRKWVRHTGRQQKSEDIAAAEHELDTLSRTLSFDLDDPLDAQQVASWRDSLSHKTDSITHVGPNLELTTVNEGTGEIVRVHFVVREADYMPVAERLETRHGDILTIAEVTETEAAAVYTGTHILEHPPEYPPRTLETLPSPTAADLAQSELMARIAMHQIGADMGEELQLESGSRAIRIVGRTESNERGEQIKRTLAGIPWIRIDLRPFSGIPASRSARVLTTGAVTHDDSTIVPLEEQMSSAIPSVDERVEFVNTMLASAEAATEHAWAIEHLAQRYDERQISLLTPSSKQALDLLVQTHSEELMRQMDEIEAGISRILGTSRSLPPLSHAAAPWQQSAENALLSIRSLHETLLTDLSGSNGDHSLQTAEETAQKLRQRFADSKSAVFALQQSLSFHPPIPQH
jgi:hypothetical protein